MGSFSALVMGLERSFHNTPRGCLRILLNHITLRKVNNMKRVVVPCNTVLTLDFFAERQVQFTGFLSPNTLERSSHEKI